MGWGGVWEVIYIFLISIPQENAQVHSTVAENRSTLKAIIVKFQVTGISENSLQAFKVGVGEK